MAAADASDVVAIARDLVAVPLASFTGERTARARAARDAGDRDLAARITALTKPSASAWLVDRLVREGRDDLDRVLDLGARLRQEQAAPDRVRLRELGAERRALLAEVVGRVADAAEADGRRPTAAVLEEVQQTLLAAMTDEDAATAVLTARLVRPLAVEGLDPVDLTNAVAIGDRLDPADGGAAPRRRRAPAPAEPSQEPAEPAEPDDGRAGRAARRAEAAAAAEEAHRAARAARRTADDAADAADAADGAVQERQHAAEALEAELADLQQRLEDARRARDAARGDAVEARAAADDAARTADEAEQADDEAAERLAGLPED